MTTFRDWMNDRRQSKAKGRRRVDERDLMVLELVPWVAEAAREPELFEGRARTAAERLGPGNQRTLSKYLYHYFPPTEAVEGREEFEPLFKWPDACREALFHILYRLGPESLPLLYAVAFGEYDWTQVNAIRILCRFGRDGVEREQIAQDIADHFHEWRWDEITSVVLPVLCEFALNAPPLLKIFAMMIREDDSDAIDVFNGLARYSPEIGRHYEPALRKIMCATGRTPQDRLQSMIAAEERESERKAQQEQGEDDDDGNDDKDEEEDDGLPPCTTFLEYIDRRAIGAAFLLVKLFPNDQEALSNLHSWEDNHPSARIRQTIANHLSEMA